MQVQLTWNPHIKLTFKLFIVNIIYLTINKSREMMIKSVYSAGAEGVFTTISNIQEPVFVFVLIVYYTHCGAEMVCVIKKNIMIYFLIYLKWSV